MKYRILYDYGREGHYLSEEEYGTIDLAVKIAIEHQDNFLIITIVDWEAVSIIN